MCGERFHCFSWSFQFNTPAVSHGHSGSWFNRLRPKTVKSLGPQGPSPVPTYQGFRDRHKDPSSRNRFAPWKRPNSRFGDVSLGNPSTFSEGTWTLQNCITVSPITFWESAWIPRVLVSLVASRPQGIRDVGAPVQALHCGTAATGGRGEQRRREEIGRLPG